MGRGLSLPVPAVVAGTAHHGITACVMGKGLFLPVPAVFVLCAGYGITAAVLGQQRLFSSLQDLELNFTKLSGPLPAEWGSPASFQRLQTFCIYDSTITGK